METQMIQIGQLDPDMQRVDRVPTDPALGGGAAGADDEERAQRHHQPPAGDYPALRFRQFREIVELLLVDAAHRSRWQVLRRQQSRTTRSVYFRLWHPMTNRHVTVRISDHEPRIMNDRRLSIALTRPAAGIGGVFRRLHQAQKAAEAIGP